MAETIADTRRLISKPQNLNDAYGPPSNFLEIDVGNPQTVGVGRGRFTTYEIRVKVRARPGPPGPWSLARLREAEAGRPAARGCFLGSAGLVAAARARAGGQGAVGSSFGWTGGPAAGLGADKAAVGPAARLSVDNRERALRGALLLGWNTPLGRAVVWLF